MNHSNTILHPLLSPTLVNDFQTNTELKAIINADIDSYSSEDDSTPNSIKDSSNKRLTTHSHNKVYNDNQNKRKESSLVSNNEAENVPMLISNDINEDTNPENQNPTSTSTSSSISSNHHNHHPIPTIPKEWKSSKYLIMRREVENTRERLHKAINSPYGTMNHNIINDKDSSDDSDENTNNKSISKRNAKVRKNRTQQEKEEQRQDSELSVLMKAWSGTTKEIVDNNNDT